GRVRRARRAGVTSPGFLLRRVLHAEARMPNHLLPSHRELRESRRRRIIWRVFQTAALSSAARATSRVAVRGLMSMTKKNRSVVLASLVTAFLLSGVFAVAEAQTPVSPAAKPTNWSDPNTWPNHKVPVAGDKPTIGRDKEVILDVSPPALLGLSIDGKLTF